MKSAAFSGNVARRENLQQKKNVEFLSEMSFPSPDVAADIFKIEWWKKYNNLIVWAAMTLLVIMMKYEKTVNKRYGRLASILIDQR